ncbi:MAG: disulfide bond formation protein B [Alphaproteobacteria bacterium]|nr:disulfide bond formation protein B [Alphaproteobacteria bacterium]
MIYFSKNSYLIFIFLISLVALFSAFFIEYILGYQPCYLCKIERIPYALSIIILLLNFKFNYLEKFFLILLIFIFIFSTLISIYHFGIEQGFIKESILCDLKNASEILSKEEILKDLQEKKSNCKDVTFTIFGLSLTTLNIILSLIITTILTKIYFGYEKKK